MVSAGSLPKNWSLVFLGKGKVKLMRVAVVRSLSREMQPTRKGPVCCDATAGNHQASLPRGDNYLTVMGQWLAKLKTNLLELTTLLELLEDAKVTVISGLAIVKGKQDGGAHPPAVGPIY